MDMMDGQSVNIPGKVVAAEKVDKFKLELDRYLDVMEIEGYGDVDRTFREFWALMGDCVHVYGVLLVGVLSRGVVWSMLYVFNQANVASPEGGKKRKKNNYKNYKNLIKKNHFLIN